MSEANKALIKKLIREWERNNSFKLLNILLTSFIGLLPFASLGIFIIFLRFAFRYDMTFIPYFVIFSFFIFAFFSIFLLSFIFAISYTVFSSFRGNMLLKFKNNIHPRSFFNKISVKDLALLSEEKIISLWKNKGYHLPIYQFVLFFLCIILLMVAVTSFFLATKI